MILELKKDDEGRSFYCGLSSIYDLKLCYKLEVTICDLKFDIINMGGGK
jgi:hypothetical protein